MTKLQIRPFEPKDAQAVCDVINSCVPSMQGLNSAARFHICASNIPADLIADLRDTYALVAEWRGIVVAIGALQDAEIRRVYVCPDVQGHGIGSALIGALEQEARQRGLNRISAEASPNSVAFYERQGYQREGEARTEVGKAVFEVVQMSKSMGTEAGV